MLVNRTLSQFQLEWDESTRSVRITSEKAYTAVGGELTLTGTGTVSAHAAPAIYENGNVVHRPAYLIHGNTYQRLNDIADYAVSPTGNAGKAAI